MQDISQRRDRKKGKASVKEDGGRGITFRYIREVKRRDRYENVFVRPMNYVKTLKLQSRVGDLDLPERRKTYTSCRQEEGEDAQMCLLRQILWRSNDCRKHALSSDSPRPYVYRYSDERGALQRLDSLQSVLAAE